MKLSRADRYALARRRLALVLRAQTVSVARTLEQKIADAGPNQMRINPHILTTVRRAMANEGIISEIQRGGAPWYHLTSTPLAEVEKRLAVLVPIHRALQDRKFLQRMGQALEIAVYRGLAPQKSFTTFGAFLDLASHDDSTLYTKEEPPSSVSGQRMTGRVDFVLLSNTAGLVAVEVKNLREWLYPDRPEVKEILAKALSVDAVPVLIARRVPYVTFKLLNPCGVIIHQTYNQRFADADHDLAEKAKRKDLLGYHDIRTGNQPDDRMLKFIGHNLPGLLTETRARFDENRDLLDAFIGGGMSYTEFAARVRRRVGGTNEDNDWDE